MLEQFNNIVFPRSKLLYRVYFGLHATFYRSSVSGRDLITPKLMTKDFERMADCIDDLAINMPDPRSSSATPSSAPRSKDPKLLEGGLS